MKEAFATLVAILAGIAALLFLSFVLSWPVMMLWNGCLVGAVAFVQEITWLQAWGLQFLFNLLFKASITTKSK
jgi:type III secretory pathway component EscS